MKLRIFKKAALVLTAVAFISSCSKKLDLFPTNDLTPDKVYATSAGYKSVLAKLYATLSLTGNVGPAGSPDIAGGLDEGSQVPFIRSFFNHQELPTDEAIVAWDDQTIKNFHNMNWNSADPFILGMYARPIYNITLINEYIRESADDKVAARGITGNDAAEIKKSRAEARFLRAFNYWVMMDLFGKSTFITEADGIGFFLPAEKDRAGLFTYIESELKAVEAELGNPKTAEYGRVDKAAVWSLLARIYLNAKIYTGTERNTEAITYASKVLTAGYSLHPKYKELFMADNNLCTDEIIWTANCDGLQTQSYGNTTFFIHAASGSDNNDFGASGGWSGYRSTKGLANLFPAGANGNLDSTRDKRAAMFYTSTRQASPSQIAITNVGEFTEGMAVKKYVNIKSTGAIGNDPTKTYADCDWIIFRLAEMNLLYAEAVLRGGSGGSTAQALTYFNAVRARSGAAPMSSITLQDVLDERGRELFWEGHRRTDLIRYNQFTTAAYLWPWKGGVATGTSVDSRYNLYPIPVTNLSSNQNLRQNPGYN